MFSIPTVPAVVCEGFHPHFTTAVVEHVEELDKSWSFTSWMQKTDVFLVRKAALEPH